MLPRCNQVSHVPQRCTVLRGVFWSNPTACNHWRSPVSRSGENVSLGFMGPVSSRRPGTLGWRSQATGTKSRSPHPTVADVNSSLLDGDLCYQELRGKGLILLLSPLEPARNGAELFPGRSLVSAPDRWLAVVGVCVRRGVRFPLCSALVSLPRRERASQCPGARTLPSCLPACPRGEQLAGSGAERFRRGILNGREASVWGAARARELTCLPVYRPAWQNSLPLSRHRFCAAQSTKNPAGRVTRDRRLRDRFHGTCAWLLNLGRENHSRAGANKTRGSS